MPKGIYKRTKKHRKICRENGKKVSTEPRGGGYSAIHKWLSKHYGKADCCENPNCKGISKRYHWCLIKGKKHKHDINSYVKLCSSCHRLYDQTPEWIEKVAMKRRERTTISETTKRKIAKSMKGKNIGNAHSAKKIEQRSKDTGYLINIWSSISSAAKDLNLNESGISMCCRGLLKSSGGYKWNFHNR